MSKQGAPLPSSSPVPSREMKAKLAEATGPSGINVDFFLFLFFQPHSDKVKWTYIRYTGGWAAGQGSPDALGHLSHFPDGSPWCLGALVAQVPGVVALVEDKARRAVGRGTVP